MFSDINEDNMVTRMYSDNNVKSNTYEWIKSISPYKYTYNFKWLGIPIIQLPQDMIAVQELLYAIKPDLVIEMGIAHGGSLIFSASMLEINALCGGPRDAKVLGVDIDIRPHNRKLIEEHPLFSRISMIEGSSIEPSVIQQVKDNAKGKQCVFVCLDSNHTHNHVLSELNAYAPLVTIGSYCVVFDTNIEDMPVDMSLDKPWGSGNNPKTAVWDYLKSHPEFEIDKSIEQKLLITASPDGYLKRIA